MGWFVIVEKYHSICAGSGDTLQNFVKYGNSQHKVTKTSLLTQTVCQQPIEDVVKVCHGNRTPAPRPSHSVAGRHWVYCLFSEVLITDIY